MPAQSEQAQSEVLDLYQAFLKHLRARKPPLSLEAMFFNISPAAFDNAIAEHESSLSMDLSTAAFAEMTVRCFFGRRLRHLFWLTVFAAVSLQVDELKQLLLAAGAGEKVLGISLKRCSSMRSSF